MVGIVLLGIAGALVFTVLVQGIAGSSGSRAGGISDAAIARTADAMGDDIARAATNDNLGGAVRDEVGFANAVRRYAVAWKPARDAAGAVDTRAPQLRADIDDVRFATPTAFQVVAGNECITWRTTGTNGGYEVTRAVAPATNCNAPTETRRFLTARSTAPGFNSQPFSYMLVCNPGVCPGSGAAGATPCRPWRVASVPANRLRWIVGVDASFVSLTQSGKEAAAGHGSISQTIRSRDIETYREALGC